MKTKIRLRETGKNLGLTFKEDVCNFYKLQDGTIFEMELRDDCIILYPTSEIKERSARGRKKKEEWFLISSNESGERTFSNLNQSL